MKLPHLAPLIFAKDVLSLEDKKAKVLCEFSDLPSLSMFIEAAAQASAAFENTEKIGFVTKVKNVELLNKICGNRYIIEINMEVEIGNIIQFFFIARDEEHNIETASGTITLLIQG